MDDTKTRALVSLLLACCSVLGYDYLLTFDQEVSLVWSRRPNLGTVLFVLNRYTPFIESCVSLYVKLVVLTPERCAVYTAIYIWFIVFGIIIAEIILMVRTYAIWNRDRRILYILIAMGLFVLIPGSIVTHLEVQSLHFISTPGRIGCHFNNPSAIIFVAYLLLLISETVIIILTLIRAVSHLRRSRAPLVVNLYRDGLLFYVCCLVFSLANILLSVTGPSYLKNWLITPQHVAHSLCGTRVLLFIFRTNREHATVSSGTGDRTTSFSAQLFTSFIPTPLTVGTVECGEELVMTGIGHQDTSSEDKNDTLNVVNVCGSSDEERASQHLHENSRIYVQPRIPE